MKQTLEKKLTPEQLTHLAADIRHADCAMIVTDTVGSERLASLDHGLAADMILSVDDSGYHRRIEAHRERPRAAARP